MTTVMMLERSSALRGTMAEVVVLRDASASDTEPVMAMLARCSRETLYHRFHGAADAVSYFSALLQDGPVQQTLLAWYGSTCVGVATLGVGATGVIDLAVLVEDAMQRRGIGTQLTEALLDSARSNGVSSVHADVLADDRFIIKALRRIATLTVSISRGTWSIDVALGCEPCKSAENTPSVVPEPPAGRGGRRLDQLSESGAISHLADSVGLAQGEPFDSDGFIGEVAQPLLVQKRMPRSGAS